jgi:hypothetical protein
MKYTHYIAALLVAATFTSCGGSDKESTPAESTNTAAPVPANAAQPVATPVTQPVPQQVAPATTTAQAPATTAPATVPPKATAAPVVTKTAVGLNPAHGQPGHRCEIPVGAPLDSKPTQPTTVNTAPQSVVTQPSAQPVVINPATTPVATGPGLNPEHGKPGHRCDIAVGAPLNSKPTQ